MNPSLIRTSTKFVVLNASASNLAGAAACHCLPSRAAASRIDAAGMGRYLARVAVNPATGFRSLNNTQRISRRAAFAAFARPQWAARVRRASALPVRVYRSANLTVLRRPTRFAAGGGLFNATPEGTMNTIICRALSRLFPAFAVPVSTLPTLTEARALAALLVSRGRRAVITPAVDGFAVAEVRA